MVRIDFESLPRELELLVTDRNSDFFHSIVSKMLFYLDFRFKENWYEVDAVDEDKPLQTSNIVDAIASCALYQIKNFARREKFECNKDFVVATTHHKTLADFIAVHYVARSVMSNSTLGLKNKVIEASDLRKKFHGPPKDPLALAFDAGYIVRLDNNYFLHPKFLYTLCLEKKEK